MIRGSDPVPRGENAEKMRIIKAAVGALCVLFMLLPLSGCMKRHVLDGPGMVNDLAWSEFTITGDGSFSEYAFSLTVQSGENRICGELRDADGTLFQLEATEIHPDDFRYLRSLYIGEFIEIKSEEQRSPHVKMNIRYLDGTPEEKEISEELAAEICERFLPYFDINN